MTFEIVAALLITTLAMLAFVLQWGTVDLVAMLGLVCVSLLGIITPYEALSGFSNPATITVLAMFILSEAVAKTGALNLVGHKILGLSGGNKSLSLLMLMVFVGVVSMFINNTAAVALLIPVTLQISKAAKWSPSALLMPLSFASMAGGVCTLIGTSTNLLADSILVESGLKGFSVFGFFEYGIIFFLVGIVYIIIFYDKLIPVRRDDTDETASYEVDNYFTCIKVNKNSPYVNMELDDESFDFQVLDRLESSKPKVNKVSVGDILYVAADIQALKDLEGSKHIEVLPTLDFAEGGEIGSKRKLVEAVVSPDSKIVNMKLSRADLFKRYGLKVLAIRHRQKVEKHNLAELTVRAGDMLLMAVPEDQIDRLREAQAFVLVREPEIEVLKKEKIPIIGLVMTIVVLLASFNLVPIYISSLLGVCLMVLFNVLSFDEAYKAVNWRIIFLLAGLLAIGGALEKSGATELISSELLFYLKDYGKTAIIAGFFILSIILTSILSNNTAAVIIVPIAIESAKSVGIDPIHLTIVVMFAASLSFLTPIGYQTNMMVYGVGQYKFSDFLRFGGPLTLLMLITAVFVFS